MGLISRTVSKLTFWFSVGAAIMVTDAVAAGQDRATARVSARLEIVEATTVQEIRVLSFGQIQGGEQDGSVTITPSGERFARGGAVLLNGSQPTAARLQVTGAPNTRYEVSVPKELSAIGAGEKILPIRNITLRNLESGRAGGQGRLSPYGSDALSVGAQLFVPAGMPASTYTLELPITVSYD